MQARLDLPCIAITAAVAVGTATAMAQSDISPNHRHGWAENVGWTKWLHGRPQSGDGVRIYETYLGGFVWGENIGWIDLGDGDPGADGGAETAYANIDGSDVGINLTLAEGVLRLSGYAWGENVGWIRFGVGLNPTWLDAPNNRLRGYAWGENIGWINLDDATHFVGIVASGDLEGDVDGDGDVDCDDLDILIGCLNGPDIAPAPGCDGADLDDDIDIDLHDFAVLQREFNQPCPSGWGNALQFNTPFANGDAVRVPEAVFNGLGDFTVEMWVYVTEAGSGTTATNCYMSLAQEESDNYFLLFSTPDGDVGANFLGNEDLPLGSPVMLDEWTHIAVSREGTVMTLYLNGTQQTGRIVSPAALSVDVGGAYFGNDQDCVGNCFDEPEQAFTGSMDDLRVWSRALGQAEIQGRMQAPLLGTEPGLRAYWRFDELDGQLLIDSSGNGFTGNLGTTGDPAGDVFDPLRIPSSVP